MQSGRHLIADCFVYFRHRLNFLILTADVSGDKVVNIEISYTVWDIIALLGTVFVDKSKCSYK